MNRDPGHIQQLETAPHVTAKFPIDVDPIRWAHALAEQNRTMHPPNVMPHGKLYARVNWSRWIVDCPFCKAAQDASRAKPIFWCVECDMLQNEYAPMTVAFPLDADEIERVLMQRHNPKSRNWTPGETLNDLIKENRDYGDGNPLLLGVK